MRICLLALIAGFFIPMTLAQTPGPCTLATQAEIKEALGTDIGEGKLNPSNQTLCEYKIGAFGSLSFFVRQNNPNDSPDKMIPELTKRKMAVTDAPGVGDRSFFAAPGYGMVQLNSFKGKTYVLITLLVPGTPESKVREMAVKLMQKVLTKF